MRKSGDISIGYDYKLEPTAHNPALAKKMGISVSVAKEFNRADTRKARRLRIIRKHS